MSPSTPERDAWRALGLVPTPGATELRVSPADVVLDGRPILYGVDHEGRYHLLVPVPQDTLIDADRRSAGVHLASRTLNDDIGGIVRFVDIACQKRHLHELFIHVADEMVQELRDSHNPVATCRIVLGRWRELLNRDASAFLSEHALSGLYGELWHLREMSLISPNAIQSWTGPGGARHDFVRNAVALEVKTTLRLDEQRYEIHGIDQLCAPEGGVLYFVATKAELCKTGGESVPELLAQLEKLGVEALELRSRLSEAGYHPADEDYYSSARFRVVATEFFRVDESFPRIIRTTFGGGELPSRIVRLAYIIDLSGMSGDALPAEATAYIYSLLSGI